MRQIIKTAASWLLCFLGLNMAYGAHPSRGLWVGEIALNQVNEATGAVGDSNTYEFTDPQTTTPTSDTAYLRLILHVNRAGQVQLLKSAAIARGNINTDESADLVIITNPELYPSYPGIAHRVASAFYDFGDANAVRAIQKLIDQSSSSATTRALAGNSEATIRSAVQAEMNNLVSQANVAPAYLDRSSNPNSFLTNQFFSIAEAQSVGSKIAEVIHLGTKTASDFALADGATATSYNPFSPGPDPLAGRFGSVVNAAIALRDSTVYGDTRGIDAVVNIAEGVAVAVEAMESSQTLAEKTAVAQRIAEEAWQNAGDTEQNFNQFLAGDAFTGLSDAILESVVSAALDADAAGNDVKSAIQAAVGQVVEYEESNLAAQVVYSSGWNPSVPDIRGERAVDSVVEGAKDAAAAQVAISRDRQALTEVVRQAMSNAENTILPGVIFATAPSDAYSNYVVSNEFTNAGTKAANEAAAEAYLQFSQGITNPTDLLILTTRAVAKALLAERNSVAALPKFQVTLNGSLEPGAMVNGEFLLPALAPTNPFLHRMHPDHRIGFPITRRIQISVDSVQDSTLSSYGVSRLTGVYEEEIFGLHKALGPQQDIGLKTRGPFTLNRLTLEDTLNF